MQTNKYSVTSYIPWETIMIRLSECAHPILLFMIIIKLLIALLLKEEELHDVMANVLGSDIVESKFNLQSCHYIHFQTNTLRKSLNHFILPVLFLLSKTTYILIGFLLWQWSLIILILLFRKEWNILICISWLSPLYLCGHESGTNGSSRQKRVRLCLACRSVIWYNEKKRKEKKNTHRCFNNPPSAH